MSPAALPALLAAFREFAAVGGGVVDGALLVSRLVKPDTDADWCRAALSRLAADAPAAATPEMLVDALREAGFGGAELGYFHRPLNSSIEHVLKTHRGLPIALGVVLIGVAERIGLEAAGVNFPRRFLVTLGDALVDPFEMALTSESQCWAWLREERGDRGGPSEDDQDAAFRRAGPTDITLRMLNNLRMLRRAREDPSHALAITDCQLALKPGDCGLHIDRADVWLTLGALDMVRQELQLALEQASGRAEAHIRMRLSALPEIVPQTAN